MRYTVAHFALAHKTPNIYTSLEFYSWYHNVNIIVTSFLINHACLKEIEAFYSRRMCTKIVYVWDMDEFLTIEDDDDAVEIEQVKPKPVQAEA